MIRCLVRALRLSSDDCLMSIADGRSRDVEHQSNADCSKGYLCTGVDACFLPCGKIGKRLAAFEYLVLNMFELPVSVYAFSTADSSLL